MKISRAWVTLALLAAVLPLKVQAAFVVEADNVGPLEGKAFNNFVSTPAGTGFQLSATPSQAIGLAGNQSAFGNPVNATGPDRYELFYTPGTDVDNTFFFGGESLGNSSAFDGDGAGPIGPTYTTGGLNATGLLGGATGLYNVYFTVPSTANVNALGSTITVNNDGAPVVLNPVNMNSGFTGPDEVFGGTYTGGANNRWLHLGTVALTAGNTYSVVIEANASPPDAVSQRTHGVMWEYVGAAPLVLDNGSLRVVVRSDNGAISLARFGGSDFYNPGSSVSNWGLQVDTDTSTFAVNTTGGSTGIPVTASSDGTTISVVGRYAPGDGVDISLLRTYSLVPGQNVLRVTTEFVNEGVNATISYFDTFDPDQGVDQGQGFETSNDVYAAIGGEALVGQATAAGGLSVAMGSLDELVTIASGSPFSIDNGFGLNDFFTAPFDGNGTYQDQGTHVGIRRALAAGESFSFTYDQAYGLTVAAARYELIRANVPEPVTHVLVLTAIAALAFRRRQADMCA